MFNAGSKDNFTPVWMLGEKIDLIWTRCWEQAWIYSGLKDRSKDEFCTKDLFSSGWMVGASMSSLDELAGRKDKLSLV